MEDQDLPVELLEALAADDEARSAWEQTPVDVQLIYVSYVRKPWSGRLRRLLAADTAQWAKAGRLTGYIQHPSKTAAAMDVVGEGCLAALSHFGL